MTKARSNATANAAKGDLTVGNGTNLSGVLAVGSNGDTIVADSSTSTGLRWQGSITAGKNVIINGGFDNWQRGTTFTNLHGYNADRFLATGATAVPTQVISRQAITPGDLSGVGLQYFWRQNVTNVNGATAITNQTRIEDVTTLAGQTVTLSFYAKADSARTVGISLNQSFGSGGSGDVAGATTNFNLTTSWVRYSMTVALGSMSGKTIGTSSFLYVSMGMPLSTFTIDWTGWQLELGSVPTQFSRAGGTIQGELAACQRYYWRQTAAGQIGLGVGPTTASTTAWIQIQNPVAMRVAPTSVDYATVTVSDGYSYTVDVTSVNGIQFDTISGRVTFNTASGLTQGRTAIGQTKSSGGYIGFSAEL